MRRFVTAIVRAAVMSGRVPAPVLNVAFAAATAAARRLGRIANNTELLELSNSLDAIRCFATFRFDAPSLAACDQRLAPLGRPAGAARTLSFDEPTFEALWALEGLGYQNAKRTLKADRNCPLDLGIATRLPVRRQGIFHVGATMVLAEHCLRRATENSSVAPRETARAYLLICAEHGPSTLRGIEAESLGFVTVTLFSRILRRVSDAVSNHDQGLSAFFWHGVGRGLYMNCPPALGGPDRSWPAVRSTLNMSLGAEDEANALVGYGWVLGLVNLRQPPVIRARLDAFSPSSSDTEHLSRGLREAFLCWLRWKGWDGKTDTIKTFAPTDGQRADAWCALAITVLPQQPETSTDRTYGEILAPTDSPGEWK